MGTFSCRALTQRALAHPSVDISPRKRAGLSKKMAETPKWAEKVAAARCPWLGAAG